MGNYVSLQLLSITFIFFRESKLINVIILVRDLKILMVMLLRKNMSHLKCVFSTCIKVDQFRSMLGDANTTSWH